jgi:hypothetical protein
MIVPSSGFFDPTLYLLGAAAHSGPLSQAERGEAIDPTVGIVVGGSMGRDINGLNFI